MNRPNINTQSSTGKTSVAFIINILLSGILLFIVWAFLSQQDGQQSTDSPQGTKGNQLNAQIAAQQRADEIESLKAQIQLEALKIQRIKETARLAVIGRINIQENQTFAPNLQAKSIQQQLGKSLVSASEEDFQMLVNLREYEKQRAEGHKTWVTAGIGPENIKIHGDHVDIIREGGQVDHLNRTLITPSDMGQSDSASSVAANPTHELNMAVSDLFGEITNPSNNTSDGLTAQDEQFLQKIDVISQGRKSTTRTMTVREGDTLWIMADRAYNNGDLYPRILDANPHLLDNPNNLKVGQILNVPF